MKKLVQVQDVEGEGLVSLLGEKVLLFCVNYIYTGRLAGVNASCVLLEEPAIVYETGTFSDKSFKDAQPLGLPLYVQTGSIEAFGKTLKS